MPDTLVLIPGFMADARAFLPQIVALGVERAVQICLPTKGETIEQICDGMIADLPPRFDLLGHGLGGSVALELVRRIPLRINRLILMATDPLAEPPAMAAAREARIVATRAGRLYEAMAEEIPENTLSSSPWRDDILALIRDMAVNLGEGTFIRQSRALQRRPDQQKTMRVTKLPTLVIAGSEDRIVSLRRQEFTSNLMPFGTLKVVEEAGHLACLEQPELVTGLIRDFLNGPVLLR